MKIFVCIFAVDNIFKSNDAQYCDTVKRKQKPTKRTQICKNPFFLFQEERPFEENKTIVKRKLYCKG